MAKDKKYTYGSPLVGQGNPYYVPHKPVQNEKEGFNFKEALGGAAKGAKLGTQLGTIVPGVGNLVGAGVGAIAGGLAGGFFEYGGNMNNYFPDGGNKDKKQAPKKEKEKQFLEEARKKYYKTYIDHPEWFDNMENFAKGYNQLAYQLTNKTPDGKKIKNVPDVKLTQKITPDHKNFKDIWNPKGSSGSLEQMIMENVSPSEILIEPNMLSEEHGLQEGFMRLNKFNTNHSFDDLNLFPSDEELIGKDNPEEFSAAIGSLDPKNLNIPSAPQGLKNVSRYKDNTMKHSNPFTQKDETMSPQEKNQLDRAYYQQMNKGITHEKTVPPSNWEGTPVDRVSGRELTGTDLFEYKIYKDPEIAENFVGAMSRAVLPKKQSGENTVSFEHGGNMNDLAMTEFNTGGTHQENPLGGIPQGINEKGGLNLVEEGEIKVDDPRNPGTEYIISADKSMKVTAALAKEYNLPKKYVGKPIKDVTEKVLRKKGTGNIKREGDTITENSKDIELKKVLDIHDILTSQKEAEKEGKFQEKLGELENEFPEYMQALLEPSAPAQMPTEGMEQMGGMEGMMPNMMPTGGTLPKYVPDNRNFRGLGDAAESDFRVSPAWIQNQENIKKQNQLSGDPNRTASNIIQNTQNVNKQREGQWENIFDEFDSFKYGGNKNKKYDEGGPKQFSYEQSPLNALGQIAPIAYNIGMGMKKDDPINTGRMSKEQLKKPELGQAAVDARLSQANAMRGVRGAAGGAGSYLSNVLAVKNQGDQNMARMRSDLRNQHSQIDNQQIGLDRQADQFNFGMDMQEQMIQRQAERERQNMTAAGIGQLGQYAQTQEKNELGAMYGNMYSPDFEFQYEPFLGKK